MPLRTLFLAIGLLISTLSMASNLDSLGVENLEGKQLILHKIEAKESYYSLGRKYAVNPASIIDYNRNKALKIGVLVKIPTQRPFVAGTPSAAPMVAQQEELITYKVKPKETLYSIAKKFNTTIEDLKRINQLRNTALSVGQLIKIRSIAPILGSNTNSEASSATEISPVNEPLVIDTSSSTVGVEDRKLPASRYGLREVKEKGIATWIQDEALDDSKMLALHPTAPIGTIIKITNPMTQKSTFAKVVGKFTENESTKGVIIILTRAAADLIGALDKRFQVNLVYGVPDEQ